MARNISVGIDIGTYSTNTVVLELEQFGKAPKILALNSVASSGLRKGNVHDIKEAAKSIKESVRAVEKTAGFPARRVYASIGGENLTSVISKGMVAVSRADSEITDNDIKRAVSNSETNLSRMANKSILHTVPLCFKIDNEPAGKNPVGMKGGKLEVDTLFITTLTQNLNNLIKSFEIAGLTVLDVVASPIAAGYALMDKKQKEAGSILLDIGGGTVSLAVFEEGLPLSVNCFPFGSDNITNDIAVINQMPLEQAEKLKHEFLKEDVKTDRATQRKLTEIIEARLSDAFELTSSHLRKIGKERTLPGGAILTGGGVNLPIVADFAKNHLKMNAEIGVCSLFESREKRFFDSKWAVALGLAMLGLNETSIKTGGKIKETIKSMFKLFMP